MLNRLGRHPRRLRLLVLACEPDQRASTSQLHVLVDELRAREGMDVYVWFLRAGASPADSWSGGRVVDDLRNWWPVRRADALGWKRFAGLLRGLRLRWWFVRLPPQVVLLDDAMGGRLLHLIPGDPVVVLRHNRGTPAGARLEQQFLGQADLVLDAGGMSAYGPSRSDVAEVLRLPELISGLAGVLPAAAEPAHRRDIRRRLGVPADGSVIAGWGADAWVDGHDLFLDALVALGTRSERSIHAVWLGLNPESEPGVELLAEARRRGVGRMLTVSPIPPAEGRTCADAAFLPVRVDLDPSDLVGTVAAGVPVVTMSGGTFTGPGMWRVARGDVASAADTLELVLASDRNWWPAFQEAHDLRRWCDRFLHRVMDLERS